MSDTQVDWQGALDVMERFLGESVAVSIQDNQGRFRAFMHGWLRGRTPDLNDGDDSAARFRLETGHPAHRFDETGLILYEATFRSARDFGHSLTIYHDDYSETTITLNAPLGAPV